ncbi:hypothetical protein [Anaeromyxobacter terrae]|uniref:hypothetical protein n=1 Tax=Anaeromyxobacter terrae TaxID=2925406 RepID=UPI001F58ACC3|nr:hypothetical protein [Anaeromyxobacter sp. SG22]
MLDPCTEPTPWYQSRSGGDADTECDRCGTTLSREAAVARAVRTDAEDDDPVLLCSECELGTD